MGHTLTGCAADVMAALRRAQRAKALTAATIAILTLGIGSTTAVFSLLYEVLLRPLPYPHAERLVFPHNRFPHGQVAVQGVSAFDYASLRARREVFDDAAAYYYGDMVMTGVGAAQHVDVVNVSASLFPTLGVRPIAGRAIAESDDRRGAAPVALLSFGCWQGLFGADPHVAGREVRLNGTSYRIVGVMPRAFAFPSKATQMWIPLAFQPADYTLAGGRLEKWLHMVARLRPGLTAEKANAALRPLTARLARQFGRFYPAAEGWHFEVEPMRDETTATVRPWLYLAFGSMLCVLLLACLNVAGLMVLAAVERAGELVLRNALGASRWRVTRQLLVESAVLVAPGCMAGMLFATWAVWLETRYGPVDSRFSWMAAVFACAAAVVTTMLVSMWPAAFSARLALDTGLRDNAGRALTRRSGWRLWLVSAQVALALTLVFCAALLSRSFVRLTETSPGFAAERVWSGAVTGDYRMFTALQKRLARLPGVLAAAGSSALPFNPSGVWTERLNLDQPRFAGVPPPEAQISVTLPGYFETMRIPLLRGRTFTAQDRSGEAAVAVISKELARRFFPDDDPLSNAIGRRIGSGGNGLNATVIGVVGNVENAQMGGPAKPEIYWPALQERSDAMYLTLRLARDFDPAAAVRHELAQLDPNAALFDVAMMEQRVARSLLMRQFVAAVLNLFALAGLALAAMGLYASAAHLVASRRREIGIRRALGASAKSVVALVTREAAAILTVGMAAGSGGALLAARALKAQLFGVSEKEPASWLLTLGLLVAVGIVALAIPVRKAFCVQPAEALREE